MVDALACEPDASLPAATAQFDHVGVVEVGEEVEPLVFREPRPVVDGRRRQLVVVRLGLPGPLEVLAPGLPQVARFLHGTGVVAGH